jgi:hypothetical protein
MLFRALILVVGLAGLACWAGCDGCNDDGFDAGVPDGPAAPGAFSLSWTIQDQASGQPVTCDKLDSNATVFVEARRQGTGGTESFTCKNAQAMSARRFTPGLYNFTYELHGLRDGQSLTLATAAPQSSVMIPSGADISLDPIRFQVDATGKLELMLHAGGAGNCASGAGITGIAISLEHAGEPGDTGCAPVVFTLSGGGTYNANNCTAPAVGRCIQAGETITVASLPSGPYQIHITGKDNIDDCWSNNDTFRVPPQGETLRQTLNLAFASETPACQ